MAKLNTLKSDSTCLVLDDDAEIRKILVEMATELGAEKVLEAEDGEDVVRLTKEYDIDLFILDWKVPKIAGTRLINHIRKQPKFYYSPVIVLSGYLQDSDFKLLEEFPFTATMEKPFEANLFTKKVAALIKESTWYQERLDEVNAVVDVIGTDPKTGLNAVTKLLKESPNPVPLGVYISKVLIATDHLREAEQLLRLILTANKECLIAMTELGKVLLKTGRAEEAAKHLELALKLSPNNIERLCLMGNISLQNADTSEANEYFDKALSIDPEHGTAEAGKRITANVDEYASKNDESTVSQSFAGMLNAVGISLVRSGDYKKGIEHYQAALEHVLEKDKKSKLAFNLGLGYYRWKGKAKALKWFNESLKLSDGGYEKAKRYATKLCKTLKKQLGEDSPLIVEAQSLLDGTFKPERPKTPRDLNAIGSHPGNEPELFFDKDSDFDQEMEPLDEKFHSGSDIDIFQVEMTSITEEDDDMDFSEFDEGEDKAII